jgi:peptide/nickel transport system permease protein
MTGTVQKAAPIRLRKEPRVDVLSFLGMAILGILVLIAVVGPVLPIGSPDLVNAGPRLQAPNGEFLAGTDNLGRSQLPRLVQGLRTTLLVAGLAVIITAIISILIGMLAAFSKGLVDELIVRGTDVLFSFPSILMAILIVTITGPGLLGVVIAIVLSTTPLMIRVVRAASLTVVNRDFVVAARVGGAGTARTLGLDVLPNIAGGAAVQATYALSVGMLVESSLSFLGLGVQPPEASLGSLVYTGSTYLPVAPWLVLIPGLVLSCTILSINLVGDWLRDTFDVRGVEVRR